MAEKTIVRERTEWTVSDRTNSSFLVMDALGGMLKGKVEVSKSSVAHLDGYDVVKWMVDFTNGKTEEFDSREAMATRFNAVDISNPDPAATEVDWMFDIKDEAFGVTRLWLHKELHEGTPDPEPELSEVWPRMTLYAGTMGLGLDFVFKDGIIRSTAARGGSVVQRMGMWAVSAAEAKSFSKLVRKALENADAADLAAIKKALGITAQPEA